VSGVGDYKFIEAALLLAAGVAFGWWQLRDLKRAREETRRRREAEQANESEEPQAGPAP
jgi:hypothetical protein